MSSLSTAILFATTTALILAAVAGSDKNLQTRQARTHSQILWDHEQELFAIRSRLDKCEQRLDEIHGVGQFELQEEQQHE